MTTMEADVVVLGSGVGGSLMALVLERIGWQPVVIDRAAHPRFAIGESSTPTANMILRDLADRYDLPRLGPLAKCGPWQEAYPEIVAGRKRGFSYFHHQPGKAFVPDPKHTNELLVAASSDPYYSDTHWLRADVDAFLAAEVRAAGIPLWERTEVTAIEREDRWRVSARRDGETLRCTADFLIDATGTAGVVPRALGIADRTDEMATRSRALYSHFTGIPSWREWMERQGGCVADHPYPCDEAAVHHILDGAWMWELRFNDGRVSAGLVVDARHHPLDADSSPEQEWRAWLQRYPTLADRFGKAALVDPPGRIIRTKRLQRMVEQAAGPGWAVLPFTAGFVDPLHSTGIAHTLSGIERLARIMEEGSEPRPTALQQYSTAVCRELRFVDQLVAVCYAALPSFRAWTASTMLYFAAATTYERLRATHPGGWNEPFQRSFLCADDEEFRQMVQQALKRISAWPTHHPPSEKRVARYEQWVEQAVRPYNRVGLFDPPVPNMYPHTAAPG